MIDTDKYEGHTPAPWQVNAGHDYIDIDAGSIRIASVEHVANAQLIADAPKLLAEVKRLQKKVKKSDWKDVIVKHLIDNYGDFEFDHYLHMINHAGWCPVCQRPNDGDGNLMLWQGKTLGKDKDGNYECLYCREREVNKND